MDRRYARMAQIWAENSYCVRRKVGALVVKNNMIISDGYNGTPNAITKLARSSNSSDGATLYVTASPCIECAKLIIQSGIKRVIYTEQYRLTDGVDLLRRAGIEVVYLDLNTKE